MGYLTESQANDEIVEDEFVSSDNFSRKNKKEYYSDVIGSNIVNAITNAKYPWRVGSKDENRFFRVTNTVPYTNNERKGTINNYDSHSSCKAFYENPHEYMKYCNVELDEEYVNGWYNRYKEMYPNM